MRIAMKPVEALNYSNGGGHLWVFLNWSLGFIKNGFDVVWIETVPDHYTPEMLLYAVKALKANLKDAGITPPLALLFPENSRERFMPVREEIRSLTVPLDELADTSELIVNYHYDLAKEVLGRFRRTALVDIDPGRVQVWVRDGHFKIERHDIYFTVSEAATRPHPKIPDIGIKWRFSPPPVYLPEWPVAAAPPGAPYTTVSSWWGRWDVIDGHVFDNGKRLSFLQYIDLPKQVPAGLELALCLSEQDKPEAQFLRHNGWKVVHAWDATPTPLKYREYISRSRGEFSCSRPSSKILQNAWMSDRTVCYLAAGKPAVVENTGKCAYLPDEGGLFTFNSFVEAKAAIEKIESDYINQSGIARELAAEYFSAEKVCKKFLETALG